MSQKAAWSAYLKSTSLQFVSLPLDNYQCHKVNFSGFLNLPNWRPIDCNCILFGMPQPCHRFYFPWKCYVEMTTWHNFCEWYLNILAKCPQLCTPHNISFSAYHLASYNKPSVRKLLLWGEITAKIWHTKSSNSASNMAAATSVHIDYGAPVKKQ